MSAPISHIVFAEKVLGKELAEKDRNQFLLGTSFPDIRYLGLIKRDQTHVSEVTFEMILAAESFESGHLFHSYLDQARERFLREQGIYDRPGWSPQAIQACKLLEDELLYGKGRDWAGTARIFSVIDPAEREFPVAESHIQEWHKIISGYIAQAPTSESRFSFFDALHFPPSVRETIENFLSDMRGDSKLKDALSNFFNVFSL